jgi:ribosomal protein S18 acetylase RimI-like enzyme
MEREVDFNGVLRMKVRLVTRMLDKTETEIAEAKRQVYLSLVGMTLIPSVESAITPGKNAKILELLKYGVHLEPVLGRRKVKRAVTGDKAALAREKKVPMKITLFEMLVTSHQNGRFNFFLMPPKPPLYKELYLPGGKSIAFTETRVTIISIVQGAVKEWRRLTTLERLNAEFRALMTNVKFFLSVRVVRWAPYLAHSLFQVANSRLFGLRQEGRRFLFTAVDPYEGEWPTLLALYRQANPLPTTQLELDTRGLRESSLVTAPYDQHLLMGEYISLAVLDTEEGGQMAGYVTCSVRAITPVETTTPFRTKALNQFNQRLSSSGGRDDCRFDEFSIDGLHVSKNYRGRNPPLAKALFFHAIEFIRNAYELLGVRLLSAGSEAAATRSILTRFGYSHYNRTNTLYWLIQAFEDFHTQESPEGSVLYPSHGTPKSLLTLPRLVEQLRLFHAEYMVKPHGEVGEMTELKRIGGRIQVMVKQYEARLSAVNGGGYHLLEDLERTIRRLNRYAGLMVEDPDSTTDYMASVRTFLDTGEDNHDTFLFVEGGGSFEGTDSFAEEYVKDGMWLSAPSEPLEALEVDERQVSQSQHSVEAEQVAVVEEDEQYTPTEEDMLLYDEWLASEPPVKRRATEVVSTQPTTIHIMSDSEEESLLLGSEHLRRQILLKEAELAELRRQLEENMKRVGELEK